MKKTLILALCLLLLVSALPGAALAAEDAVPRADVFRALYEREGEPMVIQMLIFPDTEGKSYATVATWASGCGLAQGDENGNFNGDTAATRAELATVLYRYTRYKNMDVSAGEDIDLSAYADGQTVPAWSADAFRWALAVKVLDAQVSELDPAGTVTARELAACLDALDGAGAGSGTLERLDMSKWQYNAEDGVYYQLGVAYCAAPADTDYENLAVFVPEAYFKGSDNGDGTYTCALDPDGAAGGYTAATAPIVIPVNTPGYSAMAPLSAYTSLTDYMEAGFVYVHAGCRGRDHGAPAAVTDLKAAVRYLRWNGDNLPGSTDRIFTFGMSGGGAQSALMGVTGDSDLYTPYLAAIGAVTEEGISDAVAGSMCWCPITSLDSGDAAYEWMMGSTRNGFSDEEQAISDALANAFAAYINASGIPAPDGGVLTLESSDEGIFQAGSYYDYILSEIERSLNNFLADTSFPYDASASTTAGGRGGFGGFGGGDFTPPEGGFGGEGRGPGGGMDFEDMDDIARTQTASRVELSGVYETPQDYVDALNADGEWVTYDPDTNTAKVSSVAAFVKAFKPVSKSLGAFDQLDAGQGENTLFGYGDGSGAHFDAALASILADLGSDYAEAYAADLARTDSLGNTVDCRLNMYSPLYYLLESAEGFGSSQVAEHWRIRTGIAQSDTAVTTEVNLALALEGCESVQDVDFEMVWGQQHVQAERSGDSTGNFIAWVNACAAD